MRKNLFERHRSLLTNAALLFRAIDLANYLWTHFHVDGWHVYFTWAAS